MNMSKKDFIALADTIRSANMYDHNDDTPVFSAEVVERLAGFCKSQNYNFNRDRWLDYIAGKCGKNGGKVQEVQS